MRNLKLSLVFAAVFVSSPAHAGDVKLTGAEITAALSDHTLGGTRDDGKPWQQIFQKSGATFYSVNGAQSQGVWEVRGDQYCSQWPPNQSWACYDMMKDGQKIVFLSASGTRYSGDKVN